MVSQLRVHSRMCISQFADKMGLDGKRVLAVGIAGDPPPGENHKWFGDKNKYETLDVDKNYNPSHVGDICSTEFTYDEFDLVILSNVIEHVWDFRGAIKEVHRITGEYAIIDSPLQVCYHADDEFGDYWRFTTSALKRLAEEVGFEVINEVQTLLMSSILCQKKK